MRGSKAIFQQLIFRTRAVFLIAACALALFLVPADTDTLARTVPPARDFRLVVFAIGDWRGRFDADADGRGGLAALHTLVRRTRERVRVERGRVLLVHAGNLTGARDRRGFHRRLFPPGLNLPRYIALDAAALSPEENGFLSDHAFLPEVRFTHAVDFDRGRGAGAAGAVSRFRIAPGEDYNVLISGWNARPNDERRAELLKAMRGELERQTALDLRVLLVRGDSLRPRAADVARELFGLAPDQNPYDLFDAEDTRPFLVVRSSAPRNRFQQLLSGAHLCSIRDREVCRVEYLFRDHRLIAVNQRFIDLNARDRSGAWIPPDPRLVKLLRKERETKLRPPHTIRGEMQP